QQRTRQQEPLGVQRLLRVLDVQPAALGGLQRAQVQQLAREVPLVQRLRGVDALVALQPHQRQPQALGQCDGQRGLARARFPLAEQRLAHAQCEERGGGDAVVGEVPDVLEQSRQLGGRGNGGVGCSGGGAGGGGFGRHSLTL